jgi:DNA-binding transcriptional regulator GbsR (MarR family)
MQLLEAKEKFIQQWGSLGSNWGINKTMAQIHALFLISEDLLSAEEVMEELKISRGNANMNIRTLIDWGLVYKEYKSGERKEFFRGEKDIWIVTQRVMRTRQRQELDPMLNVLTQLQSVDSDKNNKNEVAAFTNQIKNIKSFAELADRSLTKISGSEENWFLKTFMKFMK